MKRKIIENYALCDILGEGSFGKVYKGINTLTNQDFAVKVIPVQKFQQNSRLEQCSANEVRNLTKIEKSPYIIRFVQMLKTPNNFYFVYEFCNGKTLEAKIKEQTKLPEKEALRIFIQLLQAFKVLNKYNIMHRDLKPDNIFFHDGNVKLGDFGFCKNLLREGDMTSTMLGSPIYMAPEVLRGEIYTSKADIWSLGVVLYQMLFGFCPFQSNSIAKLIAVLDNTPLRFPGEANPISQDTQTLLKKLLTKDQFKRIDWFQLLTMKVGGGKLVTKIVQPLTNLVSSTQLENKTQVLRPLDTTSLIKSPSTSTSQKTTPFAYQNQGLDFKRKAESNQNSATKPSPQSFKLHKAYSARPYASNRQQITPFFHYSTNRQEPLQVIQPNILSSPNLQKAPFTPRAQCKRKQLLEKHNNCLLAVKTSLAFLRSTDSNSAQYAYMLFNKIQSVLKKIIDCIGFSQLQLQDILAASSQQLRQIQKQTKLINGQLRRQNIDPTQFGSPRAILQQKFTTESNRRLWYQMIAFLTDRRADSQSTQAEWVTTINNYLS